MFEILDIEPDKKNNKILYCRIIRNPTKISIDTLQSKTQLKMLLDYFYDNIFVLWRIPLTDNIFQKMTFEIVNDCWEIKLEKTVYINKGKTNE